ncbi:MAG: hypothetical protein IT196_15790 [Acidimicrobiales bacterium]|nr:hypothetical protein [Acidimicrobiales bacterium]
MKRVAVSPDGLRYVVAIDWFGRKLRNPLDQGRRRSARVWRANPLVRLLSGDRGNRTEQREHPRPGDRVVGSARRSPRAAKKDRRRRWYDNCDCDPCSGVDGDLLGPLLVVLAVVLAVAAVLVGAPVLVAVLTVLVEFFYLVLAAAAVLLWRVAARRPWRIVAAVPDGPMWHAQLVGWRRARAEVRRVAAALEQGAAPASLGLAATDRTGADWLDDEAAPPDAPV